MATLSAISAKAGYCKAPTLSWKGSRVSARNVVSMATTRRGGLVSLRSPRFRVYAAKAETVSKVMDIVKQQLALAADVGLTAESKFADLGADSLDTVEIVMALEEEFKITVEEDNAQSITTIQEAADLIDKLVDQNPAAAAPPA
ncbi:hypothetical protein BDA96_05G140500 [Sorghum bicolor]|uniref:Acyl carrier protein n=2 Tax=Sorghum bicolor TaxID=4558 RepID=A0A921UFB4_SORBI|nr:acyl carrier protein 4, chloroplastic isoform X3 [Sorghum bicolor]EES08540.1 hypothetical protein SORBI_3005G128100 [Sorghum bicolor]KAG0529932.1 hypothetical protein BDA96_05G140000 [Sorghum bicolor]KAG0529937.1 hypothetical protein BDA96_05G140500 [Sorghum bicolor]|eukprot:XP_002449552.1 acyl carrier protein 4, chloroplastic isoform X3 [Sorghum bicolor]